MINGPFILRFLFLTTIIVFCSKLCCGQGNENAVQKDYGSEIVLDSGIIFFYYRTPVCKRQISKAIYHPFEISLPLIEKKEVKKEGHQFLILHGNVSYEFSYRSKIDTPFGMTGLQQHIERVYINGLYKEKYPFKIGFTARQSNSPWFRNFADMNFQFDPQRFRKNLMEQLLASYISNFSQKNFLDSLENVLKEKGKLLNTMRDWLKSSSTLQKLIQKKEQRFRKENDPQNPGNNLGNNLYNRFGFINKSIVKKSDTLMEDFEKSYETYKNKADQLSDSVKSLSRKIDSVKLSVNKSIAGMKQKIYHAATQKELSKIASENNLDLNSKNKTDRRLSAIQNFSIGRSILNYTELTAKNITVSGVNVEYASSVYMAFAAGKINYTFRDFFNKSGTRNNQYVALGRIGIGDINSRSLILTIFQGRKNQSYSLFSDSINNQINLLGYSLQAILRKDKNTDIQIEVAKSTKPITGSYIANKNINSLWKFSDKTNVGLNIKGKTLLSQTGTRLSGFFRKTGEDFQSFSLFSYNTNQTAWMARVDQDFLKRRIKVTGMLRQNDFTNPFTEKTFKTSTTFKTIIVNVQLPKWPFISLGYYPGSQLYMLNKEKVMENAYYILNGYLVYNYRFHGINMNSTVVVNRYFNKATDSGFVLYKGVNYYGSHSLLFKKLQLAGSYAFSKQAELTYSTVGWSGSYALLNFLKASTALKYNKVFNGPSYWGERLQINAEMWKLGGLQVAYEKSYLPSLNQTLYPIEIGQIGWYKNF